MWNFTCMTSVFHGVVVEHRGCVTLTMCIFMVTFVGILLTSTVNGIVQVSCILWTCIVQFLIGAVTI